MQVGTRRTIQVFLAAALALAGARTAWILYQRQEPLVRPAKTALPATKLHPDLLVHLPRAYLTDFSSAERMKGSTVWVRDGHRYPHFPFDERTRRTREIKDPPLLPPIQPIRIIAVTRETFPGGADEVNFVFDLPAASQRLRSVTIGHCGRNPPSCRFYVNDMFFLKDPREMYSHWTQETWQAIERRQAKPGMSETHVSFSMGYGRLPSKETAEAEGGRVVEFRPPGQPAQTVTFGADGNAKRVENAP